VKVFISWSGELSRRVGEVLRDWLPSVIQSIEPYMSSEDTDKGARWSVDISRELADSNYGILCVTPNNMNSPWLNFEAGALSTSFDKGRVSPFLFGVETADITGPLVQFQSTVYEQADVLRLLKSMDAACASTLGAGRVEKNFDVWWPFLQRDLDALKDNPLTDQAVQGTSRPVNEMVAEILDLVRGLQKSIYQVETATPVTPRRLLVPATALTADISETDLALQLLDRLAERRAKADEPDARTDKVP
jgi:hypothetical protein